MNFTSPTIHPEWLKLIAEIDEFKGRWAGSKLLPPERLKVLKQVATIESIGSSTRIEGSTLTDKEVESLLSNLSMTSFCSRDEQEVVGYAEAMDLVFLAYNDLKPTENHIKQLHQLLLKHSNKDERHRGAYKTLDNHVVAYAPDGKELGVVFQTAAPFETPRQMESLVQWFNKSVNEETLHPLLLTGMFIVVFLAIHPFQDGNGRLSRILTTLLLLRFGYSYVTYASMENIIEHNKDLYYKALRRTQKTLARKTPDWEPWLTFFLHCLKQQKDRLQNRIQGSKRAAMPANELPTLSVAILQQFDFHERLTIRELIELTGANSNTIKVRLRELVESNYLERHGKARATWYTRIITAL